MYVFTVLILEKNNLKTIYEIEKGQGPITAVSLGTLVPNSRD